MTNSRKTILVIILTAFLMIIFGGLQISFINSLKAGFNIFLILTLFLTFNKNIYGAFLAAWFGGLLIDVARFSEFGASSLILLFLTALLAIFQKKVMITAKSWSIFTTAVAAVFFYHLSQWLISILLISRRENIYFYFLNYNFIFELLLTAVLLTIIINLRNKPAVNA